MNEKTSQAVIEGDLDYMAKWFKCVSHKSWSEITVKENPAWQFHNIDTILKQI